MTQLKRNISFTLLTFYGVGTILGAGIYVLIGKVAAEANIYAPFAFLLSAVIASFTGLSYAELSSRFPQSGGEATYVFRAFNRHWLAALVGYLIVMTGIVSAATIARGVVGYLDVFIQLPNWLVIVCVVSALGFLATWGIKESLVVATVIALLEIFGLIIVITIAAPSLTTVKNNWHIILPPLKAHYWPGIFAGAFIAFYAFIGFEDMVNIAEEVIEPEKNLPLGIVTAIIVSTILYLLTSFVAVTSLPLEKLMLSAAPMSDIFAQHGGSAKLMAMISLVAVINGALIQIIMASRVMYGMAKQGSTFEFFSYVSPRTQTPIVTTVLVTIVIIIFALALPITRLAQTTSFFILMIFSLINASLIVVKVKHKAQGEHVSFPVIIPILGCITSLVLVAVQLF